MDIPFIFQPGVLKGKTAIVTGGGSGIGWGIANRLAMAGCNVAIASRRQDLCEAKAKELADAHGVKTFAAGLNVRDSQNIKECFAAVNSHFGGIDILVNNAAGNFYFPAHMLSDNQWKAVLEIDLYGTFYCCREVYPYMNENGGTILNISMTLHHTAWVGMAPACAAKSGIDALTRTLALEWSRHNIRINAIAPGPIVTEGVQKAFDRGASFKADFSRVPLGRAGETEEVGDLAVFLCSPAATWITGEIINLDGGERLSPRREGLDPEALEQMVMMEMGKKG